MRQVDLLECGFTMQTSKSAGPDYCIEPPVHRSSSAENFSAHQLMTDQAA